MKNIILNNIFLCLLFQLATFSGFAQLKTESLNEYESIYNQLRKTKQNDSKSIYNSTTERYDRYIETKYQYPFDFTDAISNAMVSANMVNTVLTKTTELVILDSSTGLETSRSPISYEKTTFNEFSGKYFPDKIEEKIENGPLRIIVDFVSYDANGNLSEYSNLKGLTTSIEYYTDSGKKNLVKQITNDLAQTTNYDYFPLLGLKSITDFNSKATNYEYDDFNRLKYIKDENNLIIASFCYNYAGQSVDCGTVNNTGKITGQTLALINSGGPLPLNLLSFVAIKKQNDAQLIWNTSEEINTKSFDIEHSLDTKNWTFLSTIDAKGGKKSNYEYVHSSPIKGENYYRLKMNDVDGKFEYSKIVNLEFEGKGWIYPNPVSNGEKLHLDQANFSEISQIEILGVNGKVLFRTSSPQRTIEMNSYPIGKYVLKLTNVDGSTNNFNIIKQ